MTVSNKKYLDNRSALTEQYTVQPVNLDLDELLHKQAADPTSTNKKALDEAVEAIKTNALISKELIAALSQPSPYVYVAQDVLKNIASLEVELQEAIVKRSEVLNGYGFTEEELNEQFSKRHTIGVLWGDVKGIPDSIREQIEGLEGRQVDAEAMGPVPRNNVLKSMGLVDEQTSVYWK